VSSPLIPHSLRTLASACTLLLAFSLNAEKASAQLSSYAVSAVDVIGVTGASAVALGVPDYSFINDTGLGFGGTSADVFDVGESVELSYGTPLRNNPSQHDVVLSAFVGGLGATDNATVQVEASSDGTNFTIIETFDTEEARNRPPPNQWENDFEGVKHFFLEFGTEDNVTHLRLTNLAGTVEGLRLDSVEGLHPIVSSSHAFEVRFERVRSQVPSRFKVRIKNISDVGGVPIREWLMDRPDTGVRLEDTHLPLTADSRTTQSGVGEFICVENCIPDNTPERIPYSRHAWSLDGLTEAPPGTGLDPGHQVAHNRFWDFDTDGDGVVYLSGFSFTVTFADGLAHTFDYDDDMIKEIGSLYQKYQYFDSTPLESWNRPVDYYEFASTGPFPVQSLHPSSLWLLTLFAVGISGLLIRRRGFSE